MVEGLAVQNDSFLEHLMRDSFKENTAAYARDIVCTSVVLGEVRKQSCLKLTQIIWGIHSHAEQNEGIRVSVVAGLC